MAGDWIKMELATPDKPEVWAIASELGIDPDAVIGKLFRVWRWFDQQTENGNAPSVTKALLDREVAVSGFCDAMKKAGWLIEEGSTITIPHFDRHNGKTGKTRALTAKRVAKCKVKSNDETNAENVSDALPREEKRREEDISSIEGDFDAWYAHYPRHVGRGQALKAYRGARKKTDQQTLLDGIERYRRLKPEYADWAHPATWLNGERWADEGDTGGVLTDEERAALASVRKPEMGAMA